MNSNNETCIQRVLIHFYYLNHPETNVRPESIRQWKDYLENRLERIAKMMEVLLAAHQDWAITDRKGQIQMETQTFDFHLIKETLSEHGFEAGDYSFDLDYTRKWGIL